MIARPLLFTVALLGAFLAGSLVAIDRPTAPSAFSAEVPPYRNLDASLYMQTSAEYRACCYQAYNLAGLRLKAALERKPERPVVILDLDETVLDNGGFQAMQLRSGLAYDQRLWDQWEEKGGEHVGLIPGAKEFLIEADRQVELFYISNRNERFREQTKAVLKRLGLPLKDDDHLLLSKDATDKTARRKQVEEGRQVILLIGDNLRDFDERFRFAKFEKRTPEELEAAIAGRKEQLDQTRDRFGDRWVILPNPAYGEWAKPLISGVGDLDRLAPKK